MASAPTRAENGREFAGFYEIEDVVNWGAEVSFTLHLRIFNFGGEDVRDALVLLDGPRFFDEDYAELGPIDIAHRRQAQLSKTVTARPSRMTVEEGSGISTSSTLSRRPP